MKKLISFISCLFLFNTIISAQELAAGELIIDLVDRPEEWTVTVTIQAIGTHWDCDHFLTSDYSGGDSIYTQNSTHYRHASNACWAEGTAYPYLALALYRIIVAQSDPHDEQVWFDFDWRTSDLPPTTWTDQRFEYSINENKIYRYYDPNEISVSGQTLTIWEEFEEVIWDTTDLEPYAPTDLTCTPWYGHPKLIWEHPELSDDYRTGYEVWRNINGWEKLVTHYPHNNSWVDWSFESGSQYVQYKVRAINGTAVSDWSNTITLYPSKSKQGSGNILAESTNYELYQNYPNPFNPQTTIEFSIKDNSFVSLKIFDILGKEVVSLINENLKAGLHKIVFNGENLESGIYFYELRANEFKDTKKLILMK